MRACLALLGAAHACAAYSYGGVPALRGRASVAAATPQPLAFSRRAPAVNLAAAAAVPGEITPPKTNKVSRAITGVAFALIAVMVVTAAYPFVLGAALYGRLFDNKRRARHPAPLLSFPLK